MKQATKRGRILKREGRRKGKREPLHLLPHTEWREEGDAGEERERIIRGKKEGAARTGDWKC